MMTNQSVQKSPLSRNFPSYVLYALIAILFNMCDFRDNPFIKPLALDQYQYLLHPLPATIEGNQRIMIKNNDDINSFTNSFKMVAEARVVGRMARMWYIKKQIKKLNKKLKNTTITLPIITRIPVYDHSYYPAAQVTQIAQPIDPVTSGAGYYPAQPYLVSSSVASQGSAATTSQQQTSSPNAGTGTSGSSSPSQSQTSSSQIQPSAAAAAASLLNSMASLESQAMSTSASNPQFQYAYMNSGPPPIPAHHYRRGPQSTTAGYFGRARFAAPSYQRSRYINDYTPSAPSFVDPSNGLYGQYGNAYGRYDGGYHTVF